VSRRILRGASCSPLTPPWLTSAFLDPLAAECSRFRCRSLPRPPPTSLPQGPPSPPCRTLFFCLRRLIFLFFPPALKVYVGEAARMAGRRRSVPRVVLVVSIVSPSKAVRVGPYFHTSFGRPSGSAHVVMQLGWYRISCSMRGQPFCLSPFCFFSLLLSSRCGIGLFSGSFSPPFGTAARREV